MRQAISALLALVMVITSGAMAVARGQTYDVAGHVILCIGHGLVVVQIDRNGEPVEAPQLCPDCTLSLVDPKVPMHGSDFATLDAAFGRPSRVAPARILPFEPPKARAPPG